jgi:hypothetical protein
MATTPTGTTKWAVPDARTSAVELNWRITNVCDGHHCRKILYDHCHREGDGGSRLSAVENGLLPSRRSLASKEFVRGDEEADGSG